MAQLVFYGMSDSTPANRAVFAQALGRRTTTRKRRKSARPIKSARKATRRVKRAAKRPARLVKGSAAAKRYMASIRRKRR